MSPEESSASLKPITPERVAQELTKLHELREKGELNPGNYDQRFARMVGELRDRRISGNRQEILATLQPLRQKGVLTETEWVRLTKQLGLA
jgi:hypothetical protein